MPTSGLQLFQRIRQTVEEVREAANRTEQAERSCQSEIKELVSQRGAALIDLARHSLPDLRRETIQSTFSEIQRDLLQIAERKDRTIAEVEGRIARLVAADQQVAQQIATTEAEIKRRAGVQAELEAEVSRRLQAHAEFPTLSREAIAAEADLQHDERRVADVEANAQEKLPAYERSALFMYLHRRGFLTEGYADRGWTRRMDRWVANLIGYPRAKQGYEFLKKTPALMQAELALRRSKFHERMSAVEAINDQMADEVGLTQAQGELTISRQELDRLTQKQTEQRQLVAKANSELTAIGQADCRFYQEALARYQAFLTDTQTAVLEQQAARTADPRDDEIVSRIAFLTREIERLRPELVAASQQSATTLESSRGLEFIQRRFEQANFNTDQSRFADGLDIEQLLSRYQQGILSRDALWNELKERQQFVRTESENAVMNVLSHPMTHVLADAMLQVVGAALRHGVERSIQRRGSNSGSRPGGISLPEIPMPTWVRTNSSPAPSAPIPEGGRYRTGRKI